MLCIVLLLTVPMSTKLSITNIQNVSYVVDIVNCIHVELARVSFKDLVTLHRNTTANILREDQLQAPLVTVDQERKLYEVDS